MASSITLQVAEQGEVLQTLFEAFKVLTEDNAKKDKKIEKLEKSIEELREFIFVNILQSIGVVKDRVGRLDKIDQIEDDMQKIKNGLADAKFISSFSQSRRNNGLPPINAFDKLNSSMETLLTGIEFVNAQRNTDVESINNSLDRLDGRVKQIAQFINHSDQVPQLNTATTSTQLAILTEETIPALETEWATKFGRISANLDNLRIETDRHRTEYNQFVEKHSLKENKLYTMLSQAEEARKESSRSTAAVGEFNSRISKVESDVSFALEELRRDDESGGSSGLSTALFESKLDLVRAENKSNWERVNRQTKQDVDGLRIKLERLGLLRDEFERINNEVQNLHELIITGKNIRQNENSSVVPPLVQILPNKQQTLSNDSSILSLIDEGISTSPGIVHRIVNGPQLVALPNGINETTGSLRIDNPTNRIIWRIDNMDSILREPNRYPKILVSPEFTSYAEVKPLDVLIGKLKLFPIGSDQSRVDGHCSLYLRCLPGIVVRFAIDVCGEVIETFECEYEKQRDKGKHDLVRLSEYIQSDGSITIGLEIRSIRALSSN
jgi:uncharacterized coiled-coil DUF342 family protein